MNYPKLETVKQIRQFAKQNKINLHGENKKDRMLMIIEEWKSPEFKDKHSKNIPKQKQKRNQT